MDLTTATIITAARRGTVERTACRMLVEEIAKRTAIKLRTATLTPVRGPLIFLGTRANPPAGMPAVAQRGAAGAEGYTLRIGRAGPRPTVVALGNDPSGCVFAAGRLLREMRMSPGRIMAPRMNVTTAPAKALRGHQIGWRPTANSYDLWDEKRFEQYIRDLAIWGTNAIELIPSTPDWSFEKTVTQNARFAEIIHAYGMRVWLWYGFDDMTPPGVTGVGLTPGETPCPSRPDGRRFMLDRRRELFRRFKHLDAVFVPGGDPAGCDCDLCKPWVRTMVPLCAETAKALHEAHPKAQLWLSNQGFRDDDNKWFYRFLRTQKPEWLAGIAYGPWAEETIASMRAAAPARYPIREYPDITHTLRSQYPVPDWDIAFAQTLGREPPMYRITQEAHIARLYQSLSCGSGSYSDGINDDIHKIIWSAVLWDPAADPMVVAREYARHHFGPQFEGDGARGIAGFERAWNGPLLGNADVPRTYALWRSMEQRGGKALMGNWRFQMALLRATYDRFVQLRLQADTAAERSVLDALAADPDPVHAVQAGMAAIDAAQSRAVEPQMKQRLMELGQVMYDLIGMQLSVSRWGASGSERGAILDFLDAPITNLAWMRAELTRLQALSDPNAVRQGIERILKWEDAGPGGYYDDLGDPRRQPHLVRQLTWEQDPGAVRSTQCGFRRGLTNPRMSWVNYAETLYGVPIVMRYEGLDTNAQYVVRAVYTGRYSPTMTLTANDRYVVHGPLKQPQEPTVQEWPVPKEATATGTLTLRWDRTEGRGAQVSEVWLVRR